MTDEKNKKPEPREMDFKVSSSTDCTGLLASGYGTEEQLEELNEMYEFIKKPIINKPEQS